MVPLIFLALTLAFTLMGARPFVLPWRPAWQRATLHAATAASAAPVEPQCGRAVATIAAAAAVAANGAAPSERRVRDLLDRLRKELPPDAPDLYERGWHVPAGFSGARLLRDGREAVSQGGVSLIVVQFNTLADGLSAKEPRKGGFLETPPGSLEFDYRGRRLMEEVFRHGVLPDVVAMQEVDHFEDWFEPIMTSLGYKGRFLSKPNSPCRQSLDPSLSDGCALFWRADKVRMETVEDVVYDNEDGGKFNQVAIIATLRLPGAATPIVVAVTHLAASKTPEGEKIRAIQAGQLLDRLLVKQLPCIIATDLNAVSQQLPTADYPAEAYAAVVNHPMAVRSVYAQALGKEPDYTTWKRKKGKEVQHTIDYLFVSQSIRVQRVLLPPLQEDVDEDRLPSWRYPSDHLALMADLSLPPDP